MELVTHHPRAPFLSQEVFAYHGTSQTSARSIVTSQEIYPSTRADDWLGKGAYFFQDSIAHARDWALKKKGAAAAVVCAQIRLGHCIDLLDKRWARAIVELERIISEEHQQSGVDAPTNLGDKRTLDCSVINRLADIWRPETVRAAYLHGQAAFPGSVLLERSHIEIAVKEPKVAIRKLTYDKEWP